MAGANLTLKLYVAGVLSLGAGLSASSWASSSSLIPALPLGLVGFWLVLTLASECFWLDTRTRRGMVSMSLGANLATLYVLPLPQVLLVGAVSVGLSDLLLHRRPVLRAAFNVAQTLLALGAALAVMRWLGAPRTPLGSQTFLQYPAATLAGPVSFFLVNTLLVSGAISLHGGGRLWRTWRENYAFRYNIISSVGHFLLALTLVVTAETLGYITGLLSLLVFFLIRDAYQRFVKENHAATLQT